MAGGLAALLDDIAAIARVAAASVDDISAAAGRASAKAAGVVIDDTAVTPQYVRGFEPNRELPIIWRIAKGSLLNKAIIIAVVILLSQFVPWILTPLLMLGGAYLCFEGAEKLWEWVSGHHPDKETPVADQGPDHEKTMVSNAIRTDFILSAEIMVISLNEIAAETFWLRLGALVVVALFITGLVYGVVALIVKMDDIGLAMAQRDSEQSQRTGRMLVNAMPKVLAVLSVVGTIAMLWVGGHILLVGMDELGFHPIYEFVHMLEVPVAAIPGVGPVLGWLVNTLMSAILGVIIGGIIVVIIHLLPFGKDKHADDAAAPADH